MCSVTWRYEGRDGDRVISVSPSLTYVAAAFIRRTVGTFEEWSRVTLCGYKVQVSSTMPLGVRIVALI